MEEKIYERQVTKMSLAQRVVDEHQIERHFNAADLNELYNFKPDRLDDPDRVERPTPKLPKVWGQHLIGPTLPHGPVDKHLYSHPQTAHGTGSTPHRANTATWANTAAEVNGQTSTPTPNNGFISDMYTAGELNTNKAS